MAMRYSKSVAPFSDIVFTTLSNFLSDWTTLHITIYLSLGNYDSNLRLCVCVCVLQRECEGAAADDRNRGRKLTGQLQCFMNVETAVCVYVKKQESFGEIAQTLIHGVMFHEDFMMFKS